MQLIILKIKYQPNKKFKVPNQKKKSIKKFSRKLKTIDQSLKPEDIQTVVYSIGKENGYEKNLRDWFKLIYEVLFGEKDGPRMGFFISFFGLKETIKLINDKKIKNNVFNFKTLYFSLDPEIAHDLAIKSFET